MKKSTFDSLLSWASSRNLLRATKNITQDEQFFMFLMVLNQGLSNRAIQERFQHSGETVSR